MVQVLVYHCSQVQLFIKQHSNNFAPNCSWEGWVGIFPVVIHKIYKCNMYIYKNTVVSLKSNQTSV